MSTDGGGLLLREVDVRINLLGRLVGCFSDGRNPERIQHELSETRRSEFTGWRLGMKN